MLSFLWFVLFVAVALFVAYRRFSLLNSTIAFTVLLLAYTVWGAAGPLWKGLLWLAARHAVAAQHQAPATDLHHQALPARLPAPAAGDVEHGKGGPGSGHRVVGRRALHRRAAVEQADLGAAAAPER